MEEKINQKISIETQNIEFKNIENITEVVKLKEKFSGIIVENLFDLDLILQNSWIK